MTSFAQVSEVIEARPVPTPEQYALARRLVAREAPDLFAMMFEEES